jgi:predicted RecA/RadA family phage recombinase
MPSAVKIQDDGVISYTPAAAVNSGDVVVLNGRAYVALLSIAANALGALASCGQYLFTKGALAFSQGDRVYWDTTNLTATKLNTGAYLGICVKAAVSGDSTVQVELSEEGGVRVPTSTVAATGSVQGDAAQLQEGFNLVTAADGTKGVVLPAAVAGMVVQVKNNTNAVLKVYPAASDTVNGLSANAAISVAAFTNAVFTAYDATAWYTNPLLPS